MTSDRAAAILAILGAMILASRALLFRRRGLRSGIWQPVLIWLVIFILLFVIGRWLDGRM